MGEEKEVKPILEEERRRQILESLDLLEGIYGIKGICKVVEDAHKDGLVIFYQVGLVGKIPVLTEKGKKWIETK